MGIGKTSFGSEFWMAPVGTLPLIKIGDLMKIGRPNVKRGTKDTTTLDSPGGAEEVTAEGVYKVGPIKIEGLQILNNASDLIMMTAMTGNPPVLQDFKIVDKSATATAPLTGRAWVVSYDPNDRDPKGIQMYTAELEVTGPTTQAAG